MAVESTKNHNCQC